MKILPAYIIDEILRGKKERLRKDHPAIELPVHSPNPLEDRQPPADGAPATGEAQRGVAVIDYFY